MPRLVLDTNVIVAAFRSPTGASAGLLVAAVNGRFELLASPALFVEYEAVLKRSEHLVAAAADAADVDRFLDTLVDHIEPIEMSFRYRPQLADANDEFVLEVGINGAADAIVTFEARTFAAAAKRFGIAVVTPKQAWSIMPT